MKLGSAKLNTILETIHSDDLESRYDDKYKLVCEELKYTEYTNLE